MPIKLCPQPTPFTIAAATPPGCSPFAANCGPNGRPRVRRSANSLLLQGTQGTTVTLTLTGINFASPMALQFTPSAGLTVQSAKLVNANEIQAQVTIAPTAPLGPRGISLTQGKAHATASNTFTVVSGSISAYVAHADFARDPKSDPGRQPERGSYFARREFCSRYPSHIYRRSGSSRRCFAAGPARYVNSTELHVTVNVLSSALPGGRDINLQAPNQQIVSGKGMLNVQAVRQSGLPTALKIPPISLQNIPEGVINLQSAASAAAV